MDQVLKSLEQGNIEEIGNFLKSGSIGVLPTDTQYGITTSAIVAESVEKIYKLRKRSPEKPMIILIAHTDQIKDLGIELAPKELEVMEKLWPNPVSIIIPVTKPALEYLHRGKNSLAFRLPNNKWLQDLLNISGPLVAPSANFEGETPATTATEARNYFGEQVDFYIDTGELKNPPSTIVSLQDNQLVIIRQGTFQIN